MGLSNSQSLIGKETAKRSTSRITYTATLLLLTVGVAGCQIGGCSDARLAGRRAKCEANLHALYDALEKYVKLHGDVPRAKDGRASIDLLDDARTQKELGIDPSILRCPADKNPVGSSYLLNPALSAGDLGHDSATIVACDRVPDHVGVRTGNGVTVILTGNGDTVLMDLPIEEQEDWRRLFLSGDKRASKLSMKDGSKPTNGTTSGVMWYVGNGKGYVPND